VTKLKSNIEWELWGKDDPMWGVASWAGKRKGSASPWTEEEFYALGESDWRDFLSHWKQYGLNKQSCLEIGCGAGRLTKQIAMTFDHVHAVDISEHMIGCARKAMDSGNVEFLVIDGLNLPQAEGSVSAIFSAHVLQHLDSVNVGLAYFRELYRVLEVDGTMMVHIPLYQFPSDSGTLETLMTSQYAVHRMFMGIRANLIRRLGRKTMRVTPYPIPTLTAFLTGLGFKNVEFRIFPLTSNCEPHPFVFATK
jgi:ubiquinone/menaquinone biosynthesis C-methylase UbiE